MKTQLLFLAFALSFFISKSQTVISLTPSESVSDTIMYYGNNSPYEDIIFNLQPGIYDIPNGIVFPSQQGAKTTTPRYVLQSADGNPNSVIIKSNNWYTVFIERPFTTIKNITIESTYDINSQTTLLLEAMTFDVDSVIIENCIINSDTTSNDMAIDIMGGGYGNFSEIYIRDCDINNGDIGLYSSGGGYVAIKENIYIVNNNFTNQTENCISVSEMTNIKIINNNIQLPTTTNNSANGLELYTIIADSDYSDGITDISGNRIYGETSQQIAYTAINMHSSDMFNSGSFNIKNNFIDINTDTLAIGFSIETCNNINFYHNSLRINGDYSSKCFNSIAGNSFIKIKNNIFETTGYAYYGYTNEITQMDYNDFFGTDTMFHDFVNTMTFTFDDWKTNLGFDQNSLTINPNFSPIIAELNLNNHTLNNIALPVIEVQYDIDSISRNAPMCDIGAKEIAFINLGNDTSICFGASITIDAGLAQSYIWNTGATTQSITTDTTGQYIVTITEISGGATATDTINVSILPELSITFTSIEPNCYTSTDGYIVANVVNGTTPIDYNWAGSFDGDGTDSLYNLGMGSYYLTVTDANLCNAENYLFINAPTQLSLSFDTIEFCGGCIGELTANAMGGTGAYSFAWNNGETNSHIMDLCTGTYTLTLSDDNNCILVDSIDITEGPLGYLAGTIDYSGGYFSANDIKVELYKQYIENAFQVEKVDENMIDGTSKFEFTGVYPYQYTFRAIVEQGSYQNVVTSYYGNTVDWYNATYVTIGCGDTINDIVFSMYEVDDLNGTGTFSGTVTYQNGNKSTNLTGEPVTGAEIYVAQDPNDEPIANTLTDDNGDWSVDSIQEGTGYKLRVDIPGLDQISKV